MNKIRKALIATAGTFAVTLGGALLDGNLTGAETLAAIGGGLVVGFAAWRVPNAD
jgi:hypothetical protein